MCYNILYVMSTYSPYAVCSPLKAPMMTWSSSSSSMVTRQHRGPAHTLVTPRPGLATRNTSWNISSSVTFSASGVRGLAASANSLQDTGNL